jgi:hypothetical protein
MHTNKGISSLAFKGLKNIKINIIAMRPNFLLHMLWPKTSPRNQQTHL